MNVKTVLLKIVGDPDDARRKLAEVTDDLRSFGALDVAAKADIKTEAVQAKLDDLKAKLARYAAQEPTARVKIAMGRTLEQIDRLELKLKELDHTHVEPKISIDRNSLQKGAAGLLSGVLGGLGNLPAIGGIFSGLAGGASSLGEAGAAGAAGLATLGAAGAALLGGLLLLLPVIVALGASLISAAAGAGVLALAFGAAMLGPIVLVGVAIAKVVSIFQALGDEEKQNASRTAAVQAAAQQRAAAQDQLAAALQNVADQAKAAQQAEQDAKRAIPRDQLGVDQARLSIRQARDELRKFRQETGTAGNGFDDIFRKFTDVSFHGNAGAELATKTKGGLSEDDQVKLQQLILNQRSSVLSLSDALQKLQADRQTEADFAKKGIRAYAPYESALQQVAGAQRAVATATRATNKAQADQEKGLSTLTPHERKIADVLRGIKGSLEKTFGPAVDAVLSGIVRGIGAVTAALGTPKIRRALLDLGRTIGGALAQIGRFFSSPAAQVAIFSFLTAARRLVVPLSKLFEAFAKVLGNVAKDALPKLINGVKRFAADVTVWAKHHGGAKQLQGTVSGLIDSFKDWVTIIKGISLILLAFLRGSKKDGDSFAGTLGEVLVKWGKFLNTKKGQQGIISFFDSVKRLIKDAITELEHLIKLWQTVSKVTGGVKNLSNGSASDLPLIGTPLKFFGSLAKLIGGHSTGGYIGGTGSGDIVPSMLEPGEFVLRKSAVRMLGLDNLHALNAGIMTSIGAAIPAPAQLSIAGGVPAVSGAGQGPRVDHQENHVHIRTPAGALPDGRYLGAQLERELARMGRGS